MNYPFISIIIPVFNNANLLKTCLDGLHKQTYPREFYEIIVVDNNSTEDIQSVVSSYGQAKLVFEATRGSYAARNKGLSVAKGEVIAFIDSDCIPTEKWLESGAKTLEECAADLVGGQVSFSFSHQKTAAEVYDSVTNMQARRNIEERKLTTTANLFTHRYVFEAIGLFPQDAKSGGDLIWTKKATDSNFKIVYASEAIVFHPARSLTELLKKQFRVGKGQPMIWLQKGQSLRKTAFGTVHCLLPPKPQCLLESIDQDRRNEVQERIFGVVLVAWGCNIALALGRLTCIFEQSLMKPGRRFPKSI
ncbi:MAG: glycosyltransferase [Elainellaceae cyanobacterium]